MNFSYDTVLFCRLKVAGAKVEDDKVRTEKSLADRLRVYSLRTGRLNSLPSMYNVRTLAVTDDLDNMIQVAPSQIHILIANSFLLYLVFLRALLVTTYRHLLVTGKVYQLKAPLIQDT